jgi:dTDP-4-amino-4,6-dideoxygalactose transaminase
LLVFRLPVPCVAATQVRLNFKMSITSRPDGPRDTVEEFWDERVLRNCGRLAQHVTVNDFLRRFAVFLGATGELRATISGRAALQECLTIARCKGDGRKRTVLLCSFNCESVCEAVSTAGLLVETFDLADTSGGIDWHAIAARLRDDHLAILVPHLFGVPADFRSLRIPAAERRISIIEDCAHTLGGRIGSAQAGTVGDAAIFSFNYDKPMSLGGGGVLLVNHPELQVRAPANAAGNSIRDEWSELSAFVAYIRDRREQLETPSLVRRVRRKLTFSKPGSAPLMPVRGFGQLRSALGIWQLERYASIRELRNLNAQRVTSIKGWRSWHVDDDVSPSWLKQKLVPTHPVDARLVARTLQARGMRVGGFNWPKTIDCYLSRPEPPNARYAAEYGLDVPIHQEVSQDELQMMAGTLGLAG